MARFYKTSHRSHGSHRYFFLIFSLFTISLFTSCQEGGDAGDLWGQWRLEDSDTKYISFSGSIVWIKNLNENELYGNFQHVGDSLFIQCSSIKGTKSARLL